MRKLSIFLIIFLIMIIGVSSINFDLNLGEKVRYDGRIIKFVSIGTKGSAVIEVNDIGFKLKKGFSNEVYGLRVTLVDSFYSSGIDDSKITISVKPIVESCLKDNECNDGNVCSNDICERGQCVYISRGCELNGKCYISTGDIEEIDGMMYYCNKDWKSQKVLGEKCGMSYECLSGICEGVCKESNTITTGAVSDIGVKNNKIIGLVMMLVVVFLLYYFLKKKEL